MFEWFKGWFKKREPASPAAESTGLEAPSGAVVGFVKTQVPIDELVRKLKEPKDVIVLVYSAGGVTSISQA